MRRCVCGYSSTKIALAVATISNEQELISSAEEMATAQSTPQQTGKAKTGSAAAEGPGAVDENQAVDDGHSNA